jgi:hypothetical protein
LKYALRAGFEALNAGEKILLVAGNTLQTTVSNSVGSEKIEQFREKLINGTEYIGDSINKKSEEYPAVNDIKVKTSNALNASTGVVFEVTNVTSMLY